MWANLDVGSNADIPLTSFAADVMLSILSLYKCKWLYSEVIQTAVSVLLWIHIKSCLFGALCNYFPSCIDTDWNKYMMCWSFSMPTRYEFGVVMIPSDDVLYKNNFQWCQ